MLTQAFTTLVTNHLSPVTALRLSRPISEYILFTLAAQITSLPVTIYHFKRLSLVSLLANPFILPAQPAVMVLGGLPVLLGIGLYTLLVGASASVVRAAIIACINDYHF